MPRKLRIEFLHMMLFHGTNNGMQVLLPRQLHHASILQRASQKLVPLQSALVQILEGANVIASGAVTMDRGEYLVHMRDALGLSSDLAPRQALLDLPVSSELNARVELPGPATLEAVEGLCEDLPRAAVVSWTFSTAKGDHVQRLTDRVFYTLPLKDGVDYFVKVVQSGTSEIFNIADGNDFIISNADATAAGTHVGQYNVLEQFELLYNLMDLPATVTAQDGQQIPLPRPFPKSAQLPEDPDEVVVTGLQTPERPVCSPGGSGRTFFPGDQYA